MTGCDWPAGAVVVVKNVGPHQLDQIQLDVGGSRVELAPLAGGKKRVVRPKVKGDSSLRIRYREQQRDVICDGDVYFSNNLRVSVNVDIGGDACRVVDVTY